MHRISAFITIACASLFALISACSGGDKPVSDTANAIYYWKNSFNPTPGELAFLKQHDVHRIYMRFFDVTKQRLDKYEAAPSATVTFAQAPPDSIEIVPTVFITYEAMRAMQGDEEMYASKLYGRVRAMAKANGIRNMREIQLDCDWTGTTKDAFFALCTCMKKLVSADSLTLSATIRLHQIAQNGAQTATFCSVVCAYTQRKGVASTTQLSTLASSILLTLWHRASSLC